MSIETTLGLGIICTLRLTTLLNILEETNNIFVEPYWRDGGKMSIFIPRFHLTLCSRDSPMQQVSLTKTKVQIDFDMNNVEKVQRKDFNET